MRCIIYLLGMRGYYIYNIDKYITTPQGYSREIYRIIPQYIAPSMVNMELGDFLVQLYKSYRRPPQYPAHVPSKIKCVSAKNKSFPTKNQGQAKKFLRVAKKIPSEKLGYHLWRFQVLQIFVTNSYPCKSLGKNLQNAHKKTQYQINDTGLIVFSY